MQFFYCFNLGGLENGMHFPENAMTRPTIATIGSDTETGMEMDMEHYFGRGDGGAFRTEDLGILTAVVGKPGRFMIEITYDIQEDVTRGTLKGYKGQFKSYGLVDLRDTNDLQGLVRYSGEICR